ncbi:hypothetical protein F4560_004319 [Saccharothrix ecbatanensis]|uniref:Uncharacterized protein n=1 Tax=Saccharothrix ecbatanensis TaxID=1105145 RepID=A0A7W9M239_9PSEU|nr:hypothetical protein [Saccharothrix ecbatanensis]MBB5804551.1 hypothetical protein [Saccharothrix ecbatanensis]
MIKIGKVAAGAAIGMMSLFAPVAVAFPAQAEQSARVAVTGAPECVEFLYDATGRPTGNLEWYACHQGEQGNMGACNRTLVDLDYTREDAGRACLIARDS